MTSEKCLAYLKFLCEEIPERCVGSEGNRMATRFFEKEISSLGWETDSVEFDAMDWNHGGASLKVADIMFAVNPSPYSLGIQINAPFVGASTIEKLQQLDARGKVVLLWGDIAREQLMPKNFVFYNPERHKQIIHLLENSGARALVCATGRNPELAGGSYPFPLIEDGDFDIPSVFMTEEEGARLIPLLGEEAMLTSHSQRIMGKGYNITARKNHNIREKIVITAHIDAKKGSPGAIDNATGIVMLLLLAENLKGYAGGRQLEIVALNGEDYYAVPGQMAYVNSNYLHFNDILLNINIDGAGYREGKSALSLFDLPEPALSITREIIRCHPALVEGPLWPQGDHSIFVQFGRPAIAVTSEWFANNINVQEITHTPKDNLAVVDTARLTELAGPLAALIEKI
jgi:aminopeptidase YwaD